MTSFRDIAYELGELVERKNAAYGDSFSTAGAALRLLYPRGIQPEKMDDALLVGRIWDKLMRVATDRDALGESPWVDIAGYAILAIEMHGGNVDSGLQKAMPARGMRKSGKAQSRSLLQRRMPNEGLSRDQQPEASGVPKLWLQNAQTGAPAGIVSRAVTKSMVTACKPRRNPGKNL